jgi:hypothetical protein
MDETLYTDVFGDEIVLTDSVRETVLVKHPEVEDFIHFVGEILANPDKVQGDCIK